MSNYGTNIPDYSIPLIDQDGSINQIWWRFFVALFNRTGAAQGGNLTDANDLASSLDIQWPPARDFSSEIEELQSKIISIQDCASKTPSILNTQLDPDDYATTLLRLQTKIDELEGEIVELAGKITATLPSSEQWSAPTLINSWVNYDSGFNPAGFYKDLFGTVHLRGVLKSGAVTSAAFTLPVGYRPVGLGSFAVSSNGAYGQVYISAAGDVTLVVGDNAYFSLDGITFRAA